MSARTPDVERHYNFSHLIHSNSLNDFVEQSILHVPPAHSSTNNIFQLNISDNDNLIFQL